MAWTHGWRNLWVLNLLEVQPQDRVLGIGFGPDTEIKWVADRAARGFVAGVDPSAVMLRQATRRNQRRIREGQIELRQAIVPPTTIRDRIGRARRSTAKPQRSRA
jgi:ubiquinone/menaquinone biosynthesis C-methylase UbiE